MSVSQSTPALHHLNTRFGGVPPSIAASLPLLVSEDGTQKLYQAIHPMAPRMRLQARKPPKRVAHQVGMELLSRKDGEGGKWISELHSDREWFRSVITVVPPPTRLSEGVGW